MPIYTRTGDTGTTSLFGGKRVLKCEELVEVYGSLDELNSWIGLIAPQIAPSTQKFLYEIQSDLFVIGSTLAGWPARNVSRSDAGGKGNLKQLSPRVLEMEEKIDEMEKKLLPLKNFILPGGNPLAANTHIARSICRRVERQAVALNKTQPVDPQIIKYLNRLSDYLFMLARFINQESNTKEVTWSGISKD